MKFTISNNVKKEAKKMFVLWQFAFLWLRMIEPSISFSSFLMFNAIVAMVIFLYTVADVVVEKFLK